MKHLFVLLTAILAVQAQPTDPPDEEETTTLAPDAPLEDYPPTPRDKCHFIGDEELPSGSNLTDIVSERCLKENSGRVRKMTGVFLGGFDLTMAIFLRFITPTADERSTSTI